MNDVPGVPLAADGASLHTHRGSLRTQLILWNVLALAVLLIGLGVVIRYTVVNAMLRSVDHELDMRIRPMLAGGPRPEEGGGPTGDEEAPAGGPPAGMPYGGPPFGGPPPPGFPPGQPPMPGYGMDGGGGGGGGAQPGPPGPPGPGFAAGGGGNTAALRQQRGQWQPPRGGQQRQRRPLQNDTATRQNPMPPGGDDPINPYRPRRYDTTGHEVGVASGAGLVPWDASALQHALAGRSVYSTATVDGVPVRILSRAFPDLPPYRGVVQAPYPLTEFYRAIDGLNRALLLLLPVALLCAGFAGAYLTDRVLLRVRLLAQAAGRIGGSTLSERLPVVGDDEFASLAETFNGVLNRLDTAFQRQQRLIEQQRRFTADASHELKTPLTIIKGNASMTLARQQGQPEEVYRKSLQEIDRAADSMSQLVQDLLLLARSDAGRLGQDRIELLVGEVVGRAVSRAVRVGPGGGPAAPIRIHLADESLTIRGNEQELTRLFINLLNNAIRHTPADGSVTVTAARQGDRVAISVIDTGCGIPPEHLPHLGQRFYRVDSARARTDGGSGLGLSICHGIVASHGGTLGIASTVGRGTTVTVTLPAAS